MVLPCCVEGALAWVVSRGGRLARHGAAFLLLSHATVLLGVGTWVELHGWVHAMGDDRRGVRRCRSGPEALSLQVMGHRAPCRAVRNALDAFHPNASHRHPKIASLTPPRTSLAACAVQNALDAFRAEEEIASHPNNATSRPTAPDKERDAADAPAGAGGRPQGSGGGGGSTAKGEEGAGAVSGGAEPGLLRQRRRKPPRGNSSFLLRAGDSSLGHVAVPPIKLGVKVGALGWCALLGRRSGAAMRALPWTKSARSCVVDAV